MYYCIIALITMHVFWKTHSHKITGYNPDSYFQTYSFKLICWIQILSTCMGRIHPCREFLLKFQRISKVRRSTEITCCKLSSFENFETELETSHRHRDVTACRKDVENFRKKKSNKMVINTDYRFWISVFK